MHKAVDVVGLVDVACKVHQLNSAWPEVRGFPFYPHCSWDANSVDFVSTSYAVRQTNVKVPITSLVDVAAGLVLEPDPQDTSEGLNRRASSPANALV